MVRGMVLGTVTVMGTQLGTVKGTQLGTVKGTQLGTGMAAAVLCCILMQMC
jgi:hypothetical protein